jgi:hypothetical protein
VTVAATVDRNLAVVPVGIQRDQASGQDRVTVTAGVLNRSDQAVDNVPISLEFEGRVVQSAQLNVQPHGSASTTFPPVTLSQANTRGTVRIGDDVLARDNAFHFVLSPPAPVPVIVANGKGPRDQALYLGRALAIGDNPHFEVQTRAVDDLTDDVLSASPVVIINDASPSEATATRLARFVQNGGGLLVVYGPQAAWPASAATVLPATPAGTVDRSRSTAATLGGLEYGHAIFEPFRAPRSGDFSAPRFYGYRNVVAAKDAQILARFDDGAPAVIEKTTGRGRVVVWTSTLDLFWNDLALKPVYLPFVHQAARYLADHRDRKNWATVGQVLDLSQEGDPSRPRLAISPGGARQPLEGEQGQVLELSEQGFYEIREQGRQSALVTVAASNVELGESDRTAIDPAEIVAAVAGGGANAGAAAGPQAIPDEAQERAQRVWWYLLFAGILLLMGESLLAHRLSRAKT